MRPRIEAYARISLDAAGEALGVARQHQDTAQVAARRDWELADTYTDNGVSAFKRGVVRPAFELMLKDLESGAINGIVAYDLDRLWRKPSDLERMIDIYAQRPDLKFATVQGDIDLSSSDGRAMARIVVAIASKSSEDASRRLKCKEVERVENGIPKKGPRPFGYAAGQMTLDPIEGPILHGMGMQFLAGSSYGEIADGLFAAGINMRSGKRWYAEGIQTVLTRPRNGGLRVFRGKTHKGAWAPVFSPEEWESIQHLVKRRRERFGKIPVYRKYVLTGYLVCGKCGSYLSGMTKRDVPAVG